MARRNYCRYKILILSPSMQNSSEEKNVLKPLFIIPQKYPNTESRINPPPSPFPDL